MRMSTTHNQDVASPAGSSDPASIRLVSTLVAPTQHYLVQQPCSDATTLDARGTPSLHNRSTTKQNIR